MEARISGPTIAVSKRVVEPSILNALPHFAPLAIFPLIVCAAMYGGWWLGGPFALLGLTDQLEKNLGTDERNMDPATTRGNQLFLYKLSLWLWGAFWPAALIFSLWQMLASDHLALWEVGLMAAALTFAAQSVFIVGHELIHRRIPWEHRLGEFLLASSSYPHYATEHVYIHHAHACTPLDPGSPPKGLSFWRYLPPELKHNLVGAWRFEQQRLSRRGLQQWHYTNSFWRYGTGIAFWYGLVLWLGGPLALLIYIGLCSMVVVSMKVSNYLQHYGLRRIHISNGRFESVKPWHAWSADYKYTNWMYYNMQRHADHHLANRRYPLMQHHGESASPQLPGRYSQMMNLAFYPKKWFETIDPLLDRHRAQFYPEVEDWSAYDSKAFAARPDAFDAIAEIHAKAPRLAAWINRSPELLDRLQDREFADLEQPDGIGPAPERDASACRERTRQYWMCELSLSEMKAQLDDIPAKNSREAVEAARQWSDGKVFQVSVHAMRESLSPSEAGKALSRVAEASIAFVLAAVEEDSADRHRTGGRGGVAVAVLGALASGEAIPDEPLDVRFVYDGGSAKRNRALCRRFHKALRGLSSKNLLLAPVQCGGQPEGQTLEEFAQQLTSPGSAREPITPARCVFASGDGESGPRVERALRDALVDGAAR